MSPSRFLRLDDAVRLASCGSTQDICRRLASEGAPEGTIVIAGEQTAGRGREGRAWHSPMGAGLYASFVLRPSIELARWIAFMPLTALALAEAIDVLRGPAAPGGQAAGPDKGASISVPGNSATDRAGGARASVSGANTPRRMMIKWPNDLYGRLGKVAGILAETEAGAVIVGLGLNLDQCREDFPAELRGRASSLRMEGLDPPPDREAVLEALDGSFGSAYRRWRQGDEGFLATGLRSRFLLEGMAVRVRLPGSPGLEGVARDIGRCGELILETPEGRRTVVSGEVEWIGPHAGTC